MYKPVRVPAQKCQTTRLCAAAGARGSATTRLCAAGLTLVEVVLAMILLGLMVPVALTLAGSVAPPFYQAEALSQAVKLAHALESEVISKRFDELLEKSIGGMWSTTLGPDPGETNRSLYDDVDDFNGFIEPLSGPFAGYTRFVDVSYAGTTDSDITVVVSIDGLPGLFEDAVAYAIPLPIPAQNPYKLITLRVVGPVGVDIRYSILATTANSQGAPAQ